MMSADGMLRRKAAILAANAPPSGKRRCGIKWEYGQGVPMAYMVLAGEGAVRSGEPSANWEAEGRSVPTLAATSG